MCWFVRTHILTWIGGVWLVNQFVGFRLSSGKCAGFRGVGVRDRIGGTVSVDLLLRCRSIQEKFLTQDLCGGRSRSGIER